MGLRLLLLLVTVGGGVLQSTVVAARGVGGVTPDVPLILTVLIALRNGPEAGCLAGFVAGLLQDITGGGLVGVQALTKGLAGFGMGLLVGRFWVTNPLVQVPGLVLLSVAEGLARFLLLQMFHYPAAFGDLMLHVILPQALYNGLIGTLCILAEAGYELLPEALVAVVSATLSNRREAWGRRVLALAVVSSIGFVALVGQLWYLQVLEGGRMQELSERNRIRIRPVAAPRGILFDRNGLALVDNRPAFTLSLIPREMEDRNQVVARLAVLLKMPVGELMDALEKVPADSIRPVRVRRGLSLEDVTMVEERKLELPGVIVEVEPQRTYPTSTFAAHLLGYVREVSDEQMKGGRYRRGDMIGQSGLERLLDEHLRGRDGGERIEVDALGRPVQLMRREEPDPGAQVITTIDRRIQEAAERVMAGKAGSVVVLDPRNGDVLAMTSSPAFPLDRLTGNLDREEWVRLVRDPMSPLMNRALQGLYPPASVFKIIVAAAGLQEGSLTPMDSVYCNGEFNLGNWTFKDWKPGGHGHLNLHGSIAQSCDIFFYQAGLKVGGDMMAKYAQAFGLGSPTGIDLGGERFGLVPFSPGQRPRAKRWLPGDTVNMSIGQGQLLVTPLQIARMMAAVANGGVMWKPRLVQRVERADGTLAYSSSSQMTERVDLSPVVWGFLRHSLASVVKDGTGALARVPGFEIAGKTGTAQTISKSDSSKGQDHAWFASFAPVDDPQYVVVVLVERGGKGGQVAAPIARQIYEAIFLQKVAQVTIGESG